jgi:hypothetical protein
MTRPETNKHGNCDSWNFIVGKKAGLWSPKIRWQAMLQGSNEKLFTAYKQFFNLCTEQLVGDLWIVGGLLRTMS